MFLPLLLIYLPTSTAAPTYNIDVISVAELLIGTLFAITVLKYLTQLALKIKAGYFPSKQ
jgi:hypothetical protein